ncbi:MAG: carbon-nitrogen hydrolase family protein, partial [Halothiobacillaceae bacterium]
MSSKSPRFGVLQWNGRADWAANRGVIEAGLVRLAGDGATHVLLPENLVSMPARMTDLHALAEDEQGPVHAFLAEQARTHGLWLVAGSLPWRAADAPADARLRARSVVLSPEGRIVARYDKRHLFDVSVPGGRDYRESAVFEAGQQTVVVQAGDVRIGLSICFDLRFPEHYRALVAAGAQVLVVPAAFTAATGEAHWSALLRARAIENQCCVVAAGMVGTHADGNRTWGHSMVIDAWGRVLADAGRDDPGAILADIDLGEIEDLRRRFPV